MSAPSITSLVAELSDSDDAIFPSCSLEQMETANLSVSSSDSEDSHPSHILQWLRGGDSQSCSAIQPSSTGSADEALTDCDGDRKKEETTPLWQAVNAEEILQRRKRDEEMHIKLDEVLQMEYRSHVNTRTTKACNDKDLKFFLDKAKEMRVIESTVTAEPNYVIMNSELSCMFFNHETLNIYHFVNLDILLNFPAIFNDNDDMKILKLQSIGCSARQEESICMFIFYLMSVHPNIDIVETCYEFLINKPNFHPHITDFINVFRNWGVELDEMYKIVPDLYTGICAEFKNNPVMSRQVKHHNLTFLFDYLNRVVLIQSPDTYSLLLEPLMRLALIDKIYKSGMLLCVVIDIIQSLITSKDIPLKDLHLKDLTFQNQTVLYTQVLRSAPCAMPLGYAALQQFLDKSNPVYNKEINLDTVYQYVTRNHEEILNSSWLDISCCIRLLAAFLFQRDVDGKVCGKSVNHQDWIDLLSEWSRRIADSERSADPILLKEQISLVVYELKMQVASLIAFEIQ